MKRHIKKALTLILSLLILTSAACPAFAQEPTEESSILDDAALTAMVEQLMDAYYISEENRSKVSFAYTYTGTGDSWYYNADAWMYSASMYKVPLMMILAEKESQGLLSRDSDIKGITLGEAEELILVWSNNDYAHVMLNYLGGDKAARERYKQYSPLDNSYYHSDFLDYSYFTARYMDSVMQTLYNEPERFPNIIECLSVAMPENFYHLNIDPSITIAQKYGSYLEFNSNTGIIYTPNPFILTVMSECLNYDKGERFMADAAKLFMDYTLSLDAQLEQYEAERLAREEEERRLAEEAEAERIRLEQEKAEEEARLAREAEERRLAEQAEAERLAQEQARMEKLRIVALAGGGVLVLLALVLIVSGMRKRRREAARRAAQRRQRQQSRPMPHDYERAAARRPVSHADAAREERRRNYTPKH